MIVITEHPREGGNIVVFGPFASDLAARIWLRTRALSTGAAPPAGALHAMAAGDSHMVETASHRWVVTDLTSPNTAPYPCDFTPEPPPRRVLVEVGGYMLQAVAAAPGEALDVIYIDYDNDPDAERPEGEWEDFW